LRFFTSTSATRTQLSNEAHQLPVLVYATQIEFSEFVLVMAKRILEEDGKASANAA
jgi:hypothetical protein